MKKSRFYRLSGIVVLAAIITGCTSSRVQNLIAAGDDVGAIEILAPELTKKPDNKQLVPLFDSVYPKAVESRLPTKKISDIIKANLSGYGSTTAQALKVCVNETGSSAKLTDHSAVRAVINQGESAIKKLSDLSRIQSAVSIMPVAIGGEKTGYTTLVDKYTEDFSGELIQAKKEMGKFYYDLAEAGFPGTTVERKKELVSYYKKAAEYDSSYGNNKSRLQQLSYEIAMILKESASTKTELSEVINYFELAENYKDSATQIVYVKYALAELYRADKTVSSYEQAGKLYSECGNYKNAPNEARLYDFYKTIKSLTKNCSSGKYNLTTGKYTERKFNESISDIDEYESRLSASVKTSDVGVFTRASESIVYPGAVVSGASIPQQKLSLITSGARNPVSFNIISDDTKLGRGVIRNSASPSDSLNMVHAAAKSQYRNIYPEVQYEFRTVYTMDELRLAVGPGVDAAKITALDDKTWKKNYSYTLVTVTQKYYTAELEEPELPIDLFTGTSKMPTAAEIGNITPYYVYSVDYGRKAYFIISSQLTSDQVISDVKTYRPGDYSKPNSTVIKRWSNYATTITAIEASEKIYSITDFEDLFYWIRNGNYGNFDVEELPPISCKLKSFIDGTTAILSGSTNATIVNPNPEAGREKAEKERLEKERQERERLERERYEREQAAIIASGSSGTGAANGGYDDTTGLPVNITGRGDSTTGSGSTSGSSSGSTSSSGSSSGSTSGSSSGSTGSSGTSSGSSSGSSSSSGSGSQTTTGTSTSPMYSNKYTSLVFVGKFGYYQCDRITTGDEWIYYVAEDDILNCCASWDSSEYKTVYVNGINMTKDKTVYSFRDVIGNNISLDIIDANGERKHHLLKILKK